MTQYANELGKCYGKRGNLRIYKDGGMYAVFMVMKEFDFDANDQIIEGDREEATLIGYIQSFIGAEYAFDLAEQEIRAVAKASA
jgi:hypothetical protein